MRQAAITRPKDGGAKYTLDTKGLQELLCCGRKTAERIGEQASAKILIGRRVLWNVPKIQRYLDQIAE